MKTVDVQEIKIDGKIYVPKDSIPQRESLSGDFRIVVLQRGWIAIGKYQKEGDTVRLFPSAVIRVWGTTKGLPELVNGPTSQTKVDISDQAIRFNIGAEILSIDANPEKWEKYL